MARDKFGHINDDVSKNKISTLKADKYKTKLKTKELFFKQENLAQ